MEQLLVNCVSLLQCINKLKIPGTDSLAWAVAEEHNNGVSFI